MIRRISIAICVLLLTAGCAQRANPSFPLTVDQADKKIDEMSRTPRPFERPVLVLAGYNDLGVGPAFVAYKLHSVSDNQSEIVPISFQLFGDMESFRQHLIDVVEAKYPSKDRNQTTPVDVIGISLGGLVARYAADPPDEKYKRLNIVHLYTISSPLAGAKVAQRFGWIDAMKQVKPDSPMIQRLNRPTAPSYELVCYTRLGDDTVGEHLASPPGQPVWWVDTPPLSLAHDGAINDSRILADIERRLRHEPPLASAPPAALPE